MSKSVNKPAGTILVSFAAILALATPAHADSDADAWNEGANSRARLLAAAPTDKDHYRAGLEIVLKGGAHTYWRDPGDAGVPPVISFEGSQNLKSAELRFPAPSRINEGGLTVYGFRQDLVLPIDVTPQKPGEPVRLSVQFTYAACEKICIPAQMKGEVELRPDAAAGPQTARIAQAEKGLPERTSAAALGITATPLASAGQPGWRIAVTAKADDLFAEGPAGWFFDAKADGSGFELKADTLPQGWTGPVPVTLTFAGPVNYEVRIDLPLP